MSNARGLRGSGRGIAVVAAVMAAVFAAHGSAGADVDDRNSIVDGSGNEVAVNQSDTVVQGVAPLDGSPLTREWVHSGLASVQVSGSTAADFEGAVSVGYQFAYPMSVGGSVSVSYSSPEASATLGDQVDIDVTVTSPNATLGATLAPGPGVAEVEVASKDAVGELTEIRFANVRGTATGVLGTVTVRPYVKVVASNGGSVTTYGQPHSVG